MRIGELRAYRAVGSARGEIPIDGSVPVQERIVERDQAFRPEAIGEFDGRSLAISDRRSHSFVETPGPVPASKISLSVFSRLNGGYVRKEFELPKGESGWVSTEGARVPCFRLQESQAGHSFTRVEAALGRVTGTFRLPSFHGGCGQGTRETPGA